MTISDRIWNRYIEGLKRVDKEAGRKMFAYLAHHDWARSNQTMQAAIDYAFALATAYGEAATSLACEMYDAVAYASGFGAAPAMPANTATYEEVAIAMTGTRSNPNLMANAVGRLVKMAGADTTLYNAMRDGAQFAWIPAGDTCAFCIALASRGWQNISKKALKNGHAEHIHANCDCTYAVRFSERDNVAGYNPEEYEGMYYAADGNTPKERINYLRRDAYAKNKEKINAQKRSAYAKSKELESSAAEEINISE